MKFKKKYNLRGKEEPVEPHQTNPTRKPQADTPSTSQPRPKNMTKDATEKEKSKDEALKKMSE
jgi:hypothetical protein